MILYPTFGCSWKSVYSLSAWLLYLSYKKLSIIYLDTRVICLFNLKNIRKSQFFFLSTEQNSCSISSVTTLSTHSRRPVTGPYICNDASLGRVLWLLKEMQRIPIYLCPAIFRLSHMWLQDNSPQTIRPKIWIFFFLNTNLT